MPNAVILSFVNEVAPESVLFIGVATADRFRLATPPEVFSGAAPETPP
jgi:hypothetical protein